MKISVITVCFNSEKHIAETIGSVLSQTYRDLEYIIIDGGSTDYTVEIISSFGDRITRWISEPDGGLYHAMNKGVAMATGDVIGFLHSDDFFADDRVVERIAGHFGQKQTDGIYGDIRYVDQHDTDKILTGRTSGVFRRRKMWFGWHPPHPTLYLHKKWLTEKVPFDTSFDIAADYDLMLRLIIKHKLSLEYIPEVLVKMRVGGVSNRTMKNVRKKWREDYRAMKKNSFGNWLTLFLKTMRPVAHFYRSPRYLFE